MPKGDVWGSTGCQGCSEEVEIRETKKGTGTYLCPNCNHRAFFNQSRESLETRGVIITEEPDTDGRDEDEAGPGAEEEPAGSGGLGDAWL